MPGAVVIGAQWGDEGKGRFVDFMAAEADVVIIDSDSEKFRKFVAENAADNVYFLAFDDDNENNVYSYGNTDSQQAHNLFSMLRSLDDKGAEKIYVRMPQKNGVGLAVYNRHVRAAGFEVISL